MYNIFGFYKFKKILNLKKKKKLLDNYLKQENFKGTIILSPEGVNGTLSFKIDSQLRVFENRDKLSPSVNNDILYIVENYHEGGYSYLSGSNLETKTRSRDDYGVLYAYNIKTGKKIWSVDLKSPAATSPSIGDNGNAYIATKGWPRKLHCIDKSGTPLWSYSLSEKVYSAPAIGKDGTLYFGSDDGLFYAVNSNGKTKSVL